MFFEMNTASQTQISSEILQVLFASIIKQQSQVSSSLYLQQLCLHQKVFNPS